MTTRSSLGHMLVLSIAVGLLTLGLALIGRHDGLYSTASAAAGDHLQIALANSHNFGRTADGIWTMTNAAPGQTVTGSIQLRSIGSIAARNTALRLTGIANGSDGRLLEHLFVTQMTFGGADVSTVFAPCSVAGHLSLAGLVACPNATLPLPPQGEGALFTMTIQLDPNGGNEIQGLSGGTLQFVFTLVDTSPNPLPTVDTTPTPPSPGFPADAGGGTRTPSATASPTTRTGGEAGPETGTIVVRHVAPEPLADSAFTLSVSGTGGVSGPGPEQRSGPVALGQARTVSLVGPETVNSDGLVADVVIDRVSCISNERGSLDVAQARSVQLTLSRVNETVVCTFESSIVAGRRAAGPGERTPVAPMTGSGSKPDETHAIGLVLLAASALLGLGWSATVTMALARRRKDEQ